MLPVTETREALRILGERLRDSRLARNDSMAVFAERLGISEGTLRAMEHGAPTVQVGTWVDALWILDRLDEMQTVLAPRESLFALARARAKPRRRRASRRSR